MGFQRAIEELRERAECWEQHASAWESRNPKSKCADSIKRAKELKAAADVLETFEAQQWHDITKHKKDLPDFGERVIICMGHSLNAFVGEGYLKDDGKWYRYCDLDPVEKFMSVKVAGWMKMPKPMGEPEEKQGTRPEGTCDAGPDKK